MRGGVGTIRALAAAFILLLAGSVRVYADEGWLAVVRLQPRAEVAGPDIYLGDVADIDAADDTLKQQLAGLVLGRAPLPGQRRELHTAAVQTRMRQQRLPVARIALEAELPEIVVSTRAVSVPGETLAAAAREALMEQASRTLRLSESSGWLEMVCTMPDAVMTPVGVPSLRIARTSGTAPGALVAWVEVLVDGTPVRSVPVRCDSVVELEVLVAPKALKRHDELQPGTYETEVRAFASLPRGGPLPTDSPERWRLRRPVAPGTVLTMEMVEPVSMLRRGEPVTIVAEAGGIVVTAPGVALADGGQDEVIRVENTLSGQVVQAVVVDGETVSALLR